MSQTYKRRWLPRYSLKTFLLFYLLMGSGVAWIACSYSEYLAEQGLLEALAERMPPRSMMIVKTNGETSYLAGAFLMWRPDSTSVVVNYRGPEAIRRLVEAMEIPIFNRVSQINHTFKDLSKIQLKKEDVAGMHELEQISFSKLGNKLVNESEFKTVKEMVPPCRRGKVDRKKNHIDIEVDSGFTLACSSR